jgi:ArsR family transcriptional regulator, arsenate/arsenite/antimonite-responsive transcriptional repressor
MHTRSTVTAGTRRRTRGPARSGPSAPAVGGGVRHNSSVVESIVIESNRLRQTEAVGLLAAVADPVRWRLMRELADRGRRCVCDLQPVGGVAPNVLSYHLKVLRDAGLVTATRRGRWMDYELVEDALDRLHSALPGSAP